MMLLYVVEIEIVDLIDDDVDEFRVWMTNNNTTMQSLVMKKSTAACDGARIELAHQEKKPCKRKTLPLTCIGTQHIFF